MVSITHAVADPGFAKCQSQSHPEGKTLMLAPNHDHTDTATIAAVPAPAMNGESPAAAIRQVCQRMDAKSIIPARLSIPP